MFPTEFGYTDEHLNVSNYGLYLTLGQGYSHQRQIFHLCCLKQVSSFLPSHVSFPVPLSLFVSVPLAIFVSVPLAVFFSALSLFSFVVFTPFFLLSSCPPFVSLPVSFPLVFQPSQSLRFCPWWMSVHLWSCLPLFSQPSQSLRLRQCLSG